MTARRSTSCPEGVRRTGCRDLTSGVGLRLAAVLVLCVGGALSTSCSTAPWQRPVLVQHEEPVPENSDLIGRSSLIKANSEETFADIARKHDIGYLELLAANPEVDPWLPDRAAGVVLPMAHILPDAPKQGLVINLAEQRLYYFRGEGDIVTHPIGIGREGYDTTPRGTTKIVRKKEYPTWTPGPSAHKEDPTLPAVVKSGPDNPLGDHALYLGWPAYLIHGTNEPDGVGRRVSLGCIRLYPEDIASLFADVPVGTPVRVIEEPVKVGWYGNDLMLEAHWSIEQAGQVEEGEEPTPATAPEVEARIRKLAGQALPPVTVDWDRVARVIRERRGVPTRITGPEPDPMPRSRSAGTAAASSGAAAAVPEALSNMSNAISDAVWRFGEWLEVDDRGESAEPTP